MRSWWVTALVMVGGLVAQPGDAWAGGPRTSDFRGIPWGSQCSTNKSFVPTLSRTSGRPHYYTRPDEKLKIEGVPLKLVAYFCSSDQFREVKITIDRAQEESLVYTLKRVWGAPKIDSDTTIWRSSSHFTQKFDFNNSAQVHILLMQVDFINFLKATIVAPLVEARLTRISDNSAVSMLTILHLKLEMEENLRSIEKRAARIQEDL